jgi:hypothetical protein
MSKTPEQSSMFPPDRITVQGDALQVHFLPQRDVVRRQEIGSVVITYDNKGKPAGFELRGGLLHSLERRTPILRAYLEELRQKPH